MIEIVIPGRETLNIENIVFDYNGTVAVDGDMSREVKDNLLKLKESVNVLILTADTHGTVKEKCRELDVDVRTFPSAGAAVFKRDIAASLKGHTLCLGNGFNDIEMFDAASLSICIMGKEGCCGKLISHSDIVVNSIEDAFELIFNIKRITATLRS